MSTRGWAILGGITSIDTNIFMTDIGSSIASNKIFRVYITKDQTTGIKDPASEKNDMALKCFPNPAQSVLNIQFIAAEGKRISIKLYDEKGREVGSTDVIAKGEKQNVEYDTQELKAGMYHVRIMSGLDMANAKVVIGNKK